MCSYQTSSFYLQVVTVQSDEWSKLGDLVQRVAFLERLLGTAAKPAMDTMQSLLAQFSGTGGFSTQKKIKLMADAKYRCCLGP